MGSHVLKFNGIEFEIRIKASEPSAINPKGLPDVTGQSIVPGGPVEELPTLNDEEIWLKDITEYLESRFGKQRDAAS